MNFSLGDIWDDARGIFKDVLDYRLSEQELALAHQARAAEQARANRQAPVMFGGSGESLIPWLLIIAVVGGGAYLLTRK